MQDISLELLGAINSSSQEVTTQVTAVFADSKYTYNLNAFSDSEGWDSAVERKNPILQYKFDDIDLLRDHSGNNFDASPPSPVTVSASTGPIGYGDDGCYSWAIGNGYRFDHAAALNVANNKKTFGGWFNLSAHTLTGAGLIGKRDETASFTAPNVEYAFGEVAGGGVSALRFFVSNGSSLFSVQSANLSLNTWYFFVGVIDTDTIYLYMNGVLVDSEPITGTVNATSYNGIIANGITGKTDEFFILDQALTPEEISSLYRNATATATDKYSEFFSPLQAINGIHEETLPVGEVSMTSDINEPLVANGNTYAISLDIDHAKTEVGWRSRSVSDGSGIFADPESVTVRFDERKCNDICVYTSYTKGRIKEYELYYFDTDGVKTYIDTFTMPYNSSFQTYEGTLLDITGLQIVVNSTWNPNDYARVHEIDPIYSVDVSGDVISVSPTFTRENYEDTLPVGHNTSNSCDIALDNTTGKYNPVGAGEYAGYIVPDVKFTVSFSWTGAADVLAQGTFYTDAWTLSSGDMVATAQCRDFSKRFEETNEEKGVFFRDMSAGKAISTLAKKTGVPNRKVIYYDRYQNLVSSHIPLVTWDLGDSYDSTGELSETLELDASDSFDTHYFPDVYGERTSVHDHDITIYGAGVRPGYDSLLVGQPTKLSTYFDGTVADSGLKLADEAHFDLSSEWTIECMVQVESLPALFDTIVVKTATNDFANINYGLLVASSGKISAGCTTADGWTYAESAAITLGETYHVVASFDGANSIINLWVNGILTTQTTSPRTTCTTNAGAVRVGYFFENGTTANVFNGYLQYVSIYNKALTNAQVQQHYVSAFLDEIYQFPFLYGIEQTVLDMMLEWSTADLGVFFFDKDDYFHYEYKNTLRDSVISQYAISQYNFADSTNISEGSTNIELQANKIKVDVNTITSINSDRQSIWRAEDNESLAITGLRDEVGKYDIQVKVNSTKNPIWKKKGYFKIDDEIMSYDGITGNKFLNVERGLFDTAPAIHNGDVEWNFDETDIDWEASTDYSAANCRVRRSTTQFRSGTHSLKVISQIDGADMGATGEEGIEEFGPSSPRGRKGFNVRAGTSYTASVWTRAETRVAKVKARLVWFNRNGDYISHDTGTGANNSTSSWSERTVTATAPANAKFGAVRVLFGDSGSSYSDVVKGDKHYIDDVTVPGTVGLVREVRVYDIKFQAYPAIGVKHPLLTAADFEDRAEIDIFTHDEFGAKIVVSATKNNYINGLVILEGVDPITDLNYYFAVSGIPLVEKTSGDQVESASASLSDLAKRFGFKELTITNKFIQTKDYAQNIADWLLEHYQDPVPVLELTVLGVPHIECGDRITITGLDQLGIVNLDYWVMSTSISYDGGLSQTLTLRRVS
jgi:hypothetical protein